MNLKLYFKLAAQSFKTFITYRFTSFMIVIFGFLFTIVEILAGSVYFSFDRSIGNFSFDQYQLMIMSLACITYTYNLFFVGAHESLAYDIIEGKLDYTFLRPVNSYFFYALRELDFPSAVNLAVYLPITVYWLVQMQIGLITCFFIGCFYVTGVLLVFAMNQIVVEVAFWKDHMTAINGVPEYLIDSANRPAAIYPRHLRFFLTTIIPVLTLSNGVINLTDSHLSWLKMAAIFVPFGCITILLLLISYGMWQRGIRRYASAS